MDNRNDNTEKKGKKLIGYVGISGSAFGSVFIFPEARECIARDPFAEPERKYTYKDDDYLDDY